MDEGTFGLGFEGRTGSLCMEMEDTHGEDTSEGCGPEEEHPEAGRRLRGSLCGLDTRRHIGLNKGRVAEGPSLA